MRAVLLGAMAWAMAWGAVPAAFAQGRGIVLQAQPPASTLPGVRVPPAAGPPPGAFQPAPTPNRDFEAPVGPRAGNAPQVGPGIFTRKELYRGEGFARGSTSETEVEKRVRPGAGFSLRMPLQQN